MPTRESLRGQRPRPAGHVRSRFDAARGRHVLLGPETVVVLNATGADILALCDGRHTVADIETALRERYAQVDDGEVERFVGQLVAKRCLVVEPEASHERAAVGRPNERAAGRPTGSDDREARDGR